MTSARPDENDKQTIDGTTGALDPAPRRIDLSSLRDVRLEMAHVYRRMDNGEIPSQDASRRVYVLGEIGKIITVAEIEKRLADLEGRQGAGWTGQRQLQDQSQLAH